MRALRRLRQRGHLYRDNPLSFHIQPAPARGLRLRARLRRAGVCHASLLDCGNSEVQGDNVLLRKGCSLAERNEASEEVIVFLNDLPWCA